MKRIYPLLILLMIVYLAGCAPMPVKVNAEKSYDIATKKSYFIIPNTQDELFKLPLEKTVIDRIITETIDLQLGSKGYEKLSDSPDMLISYYLVSNTKTDVFVLNKYYGVLGYRLPPGRSSTRDSLRIQEASYEEGILIIDVIDSATSTRVWQGYLTSRSEVYKDVKRREQRLLNGVTKILDRLPPRKTD